MFLGIVISSKYIFLNTYYFFLNYWELNYLLNYKQNYLRAKNLIQAINIFLSNFTSRKEMLQPFYVQILHHFKSSDF